MIDTFSHPASAASDAAARYVQSLLDLLGDRDPINVVVNWNALVNP